MSDAPPPGHAPADAHGVPHEPVPYRTYVQVWAALVLLTGITVGAALTDLRHLATFAAIVIATVKSTLVVMYFMHLRYDRRVFTWMFLAVVATYAIFLLLTFADYSFR